MADIKISELGAALTVGDSDVLPMTASGVTSKVSTSLLKDYVIGTTDISAIGDGTVTGAIDAINTDMPDGLDDLDDVSITTPADGEAPVYDSVSQKFKNTAIVTQDEFGDVIAPIEVSPSAHAYSVGKQLLYNDVLYTVTSPIAVSDALTEGTNITASDTVIEQVEDNASDISDLNDEFYDAWKKNGAYNILPNNGTTSTVQGLVFTKNSDGTVTVGIGTAAGDAYFALGATGTLSAILEAGKKYKLTGCPSGGGTDYYLYNGTGGDGVKDIGVGCEFTWSNSYNTGMYIFIKSGTVISSPLTFKPMITTDLNATYDDYQPYAMTNRELTEVKSTSETNNGITYQFYKVGRIVMMQIYSGTVTNNVSANGELVTIPNGYVPIDEAQSLFTNGSSARYYHSSGKFLTGASINSGAALRGTITYIAK